MSSNSRHLKRHSTPKAWGVKRKGISYISRPNPGSHKKEYSVSVLVLLREILGYVKTAKEARSLLKTEEILVNGKKVEDLKLPCGLFDIFEIKKTKEKLRIVFDEYGVFKLVPSKNDTLYMRVTKKTTLSKGKFQISFMNGYTTLCDEKTFKAIKVNDTALIDKNKISKSHTLKEGMFVYIFDGNSQGQIGEIKSITNYNGLSKDVCEVQIGKELKSTAKDYCFVLGPKKEDTEGFN